MQKSSLEHKIANLKKTEEHKRVEMNNKIQE